MLNDYDGTLKDPFSINDFDLEDNLNMNNRLDNYLRNNILN